MAIDEEVVLVPLGEEYPSLVREQLGGEEEELHSSASLSENGYAWLVVGKQLYIWKYENSENESNSLTVLTLPQSGLPFTTRSICVYMSPGATLPGVIAVSPEGTIRHWETVGRQPVDTSIELEREVVHSLEAFPDMNGDESLFLLSTTTFSFFCIQLLKNSVPTPGKKQRFHKGLVVQPFHTKKAKSFTRRVTYALLGDSTDHSSRLIRAFILNDQHESTDFDTSIGDAFSEVSVVAVTAKHLKRYSSNPPEHNWSCNVSKMIVNAFSSALWNTSGSRERKALRLNIRTSLVDAVRIGNGILILASAINDAVSTHLHFGLVYFELSPGDEEPRTYDWFSILNFPTDEVYRESDIVPMTTILPRKMSVGSDFNSNCDDLYCYIFLRERGICRIRLFPRGFDVSAINDVLSVNKCGFHTVPKSIENDARTLRKAFTYFCQAELDKAKEILSELIQLRCTSVGTLCMDYALTIADDIPDDERWYSSGRLTRGRSIILGQSFLVNYEVEQKVKILSMFVLFIRHMELDSGVGLIRFTFGIVTLSALSSKRSTRSQVCELLEKLSLGLDLSNYAIKNSVPVFDAAVERVLAKRKEDISKDQLTSYDYFFRKMSCVDEIFYALLDELESLMKECRTLVDRMECIEQTESLIVVCIDGIESCRDETILSTEADLRWTQEDKVLLTLQRHLDIVFDALRKGLNEGISNNRLVRNAVVLASFILGEQSPEERLGSKIIKSFFDLNEVGIGEDLAKQFEDFQTLIELTDSLAEKDRKARIAEYKRNFDSPAFYHALYQHYLKKKQLGNMLDETGDHAEEFFNTHENINWIRKIKLNEYMEVAGRILMDVAQKKDNDVSIKEYLLSFAKIAALCADEADNNFLLKVDSHLDLMKHQNALPSEHQGKKVLSPEEIVDTNLRNADGRLEDYFRALMVIRTLSCQLGPDTEQKNLLKKKIWSSVLKHESKLWNKVMGVDDPSFKSSKFYQLVHRLVENDELSDEEKLDLFPVIEDLTTEVVPNVHLPLIMKKVESDFRCEVTRWRISKNQLAASSEAIYSSFYH
uniref:Nucleoporin_C domain-containing protein n=1 Tax=Syphacia muris TaxID=451379 RepID=A0A0N5ADQ2_9BILA